MNESARHRLRIAGQVAGELLTVHKDAEVWIEGALACGFAHAASDVDLRLVGEGPELPKSGSWLVDGVRIDLQVSAPQEMEHLRALLGRFDIWQDDLALFRRVRRRLPELTCLRTALSFDDGQWSPVLDAAEAGRYREWAVADRAEVVASLTEDMIGLIEDGLYASAELVWQRLAVMLASAECAAAGHPLLGEKWLPLLTVQPWSSVSRPANWQDKNWQWFRPVQHGLARALLSCHPVTGAQNATPVPPTDGGGWLPQFYSDGWFLRRGDQRIPVTGDALSDWTHQLGSATG
ncbi:hypothetical protein [Frankia sp. KB5]|uniref:hypothetical protein n=1 Tax=Frankia sp. KB5 TaxID=683318 RepID=UPI000A106B60|nr:hypothetical protein [Frankia sp. KB5]ORT47273.1 hypothetical protein KBI5_20655 [Frankia sp. KB5]